MGKVILIIACSIIYLIWANHTRKDWYIECKNIRRKFKFEYISDSARLFIVSNILTIVIISAWFIHSTWGK
jgi:hypothetical protein